jgi:exosome complex component RRP46
MPGPTASLSQVNSADGSATYACGGYAVIGSVNGPIEVQRRDEIPDEAAIEVNVRPAAGVGSRILIADEPLIPADHVFQVLERDILSP